MNKLFDEFLNTIPSWGRIVILVGLMFVSGFIFHSKVMADLDEKMTQRLATSPALIATVELKSQIATFQKLEDERDRKTEARLDGIDGYLRELLLGQRVISAQANQIKAHAQTIKAIAQNIRYETRTVKDDTEFIKNNAIINKKVKK